MQRMEDIKKDLENNENSIIDRTQASIDIDDQTRGKLIERTPAMQNSLMTSPNASLILSLTYVVMQSWLAR